VLPAHCPEFVGGSPRRFEPDTTTVLAGEPPAELFDRLPPRQLAASRESWRFSFLEGRTLPNIPHAQCTPGAIVNQSTLILKSGRWRDPASESNRAKQSGWIEVIERYTRPEMGAIWSDRRRIDEWLAVEKAVCESWHRRGRIPDTAMPAIRGATCDPERMRQIEQEVDHDVIAFLRATGESVGPDARYLHIGLTSSDVVDTALALQATAAADILLAGLSELITVVGQQAVAYRETLMIGRTHGMHAEPTTFGLKLAVWYDELRRQRRRLMLARDDIAVGKISGAVGTHAHVPPDLEEEVCRALGLGVAPASTQIIQRDRHAFLLAVIAGIGGTLEKFATEIRHLQRTEIAEAEEPFDPGNQGSSAMPHKRNPHASERISGLARLLRGYATTAAENNALWHERDISHSSTERVIVPDAFIVLDFMLHEMTQILGRLVVHADRMLENLELTRGLIYSQPVMLALVDAGMDRQQAYKLVQRHAQRAIAGGPPLQTALRSDAAVAAWITRDDLSSLFDPRRQLHHVGEIFERLGLDGSEKKEVERSQPGELLPGTTYP
jgi:adenylosuccinate lyase